MDNDAILKLEHVGLAYKKPRSLPFSSNKFWAVEDVSLTLNRGDTLGVIGFNGAGKSSLLKIIAGIVLPDRGKVWREQVRATLLSFGAGFEERLTGRQNIMLSGLQLGMPRRYIRELSQQIIELADIGEFIDEPVRTFSSGMRARLGFSIAFYIDTDILLIDEALATGDEAFRKKATELITERINSELTVVIVSHAMATVLQLCNRVIQVEHGRSLAEISPEDTVKRYREAQVAAANGHAQSHARPA